MATKLEVAAMGREVVGAPAIAVIYDLAFRMSLDWLMAKCRMLCESHERLRMELESTKVVLEAARVIIDELHTDVKQSGIQWRPIDQAPKDNKRVLLWIPSKNGRFSPGWWDDDAETRKPRPFWRLEMGILYGVVWMRHNQPTHFASVTGPECADQ